MGRWTFTGRELDLERLRLTMRPPAPSESAAGVLLVGEPGIGKSRLLTEFVRLRELEGVVVTTISASASTTGVPLGCLVDLLGSRSSIHDAGTTPDTVFRDAVGVLLQLAAANPGWMLAVDDVAALDSATAGAIYQCLAASGASFIGTVRDDEDLPVALESLWRRGALERMPVGRLGNEAISELLNLSGLDVEGQEQQRLIALAAGNPLALKILVETASVAKPLGRQETDYRALGVHPRIRLRSLIADHVRRPTDAETRVLHLVAVGEPLPAMVFASSEELDAVDGLLATSLVEIDDDTLRCAHPLVGEAVRSSLSVLKRRRLAAELVGLIAPSAIVGPSLVRLVLLSIDAGADVEDSMLVTAAQLARHSGDHSLAIRLSSLVVQRYSCGEATSEVAAPAALTAAMARCAIEPTSGESMLQHALDLAEDDQGVLAVVSEWVWFLVTTGRSSEAIERLRSWHTELATPEGRAAVLLMEGEIAGYAGGWEIAKAKSIDVLSAGVGRGELVELSARSLLALAYAYAGPIGQARIEARRATALVEGHPSAPPVNAEMASSAELVSRGEIDGFESTASYLEQAVERGLSGGANLDYIGHNYALGAIQAIGMSALTARTERWAAEAVRLLRWRDPSGFLSFAVATRGCFAAMCDEQPVARSFLTEYDRDWRDAEYKTLVHSNRGRAWLAIQNGDEMGAIFHSTAAHDSAIGADAWLWAAPAAHDLVRTRDRDRAVHLLTLILERSHSPFGATLLGHAKATASGDAMALERSAERFFDFGAIGLQLEATCQAFKLCSEDRRRILAERIVGLGRTTLLRTPLVSSVLGQIESEPPIDAPALEQRGEDWYLIRGSEQTRLGRLRGFRYLAALLSVPDTDVPATWLAYDGAATYGSSGHSVLDSEAVEGLQGRVSQLLRDAERARRLQRDTDLENIEHEIRAITTELSRQRGVGGRDREFVDAPERARTSVRKAIVRALAVISDVSPATGHHLAVRLTTGGVCRYSSTERR